MPLVALAHRPLAVVGHLDRPAREQRGQGRAGADDRRRVVLAAEAAAHGRADDLDAGQGQAEEFGDEAARGIRVLHAAAHLDDAVGADAAEGGLGLEVGVLDEGRAEFLLDDEAPTRRSRGRCRPGGSRGGG